MRCSPLHFVLLACIAGSLVPGCDSSSDDPSCTAGKCDQNGDFDLYRPGNRFGWGGSNEYLDEIQPILAKRCVACHGCSDSPCQLKLTSYEGILRGSSANNVFGTSLLGKEPNRLKDGRSTRDGTIDHGATESNWRGREYYSVVDGENSLMAKLLQIAETTRTEGRSPEIASATHNLYENGLKELSFQCVGADNVDGLSGEELQARAMPFGLEPLEKGDFETIVDWIRRGAPGPDRESQEILRAPMNPEEVERWEVFFNGEADAQPDLKRALMARYLYEHMFFAHIRFEKSPGEFYELIRSRTPPGTPIDEIVTEYVMDDPQGQVFYRFRKIDQVMVRKNHTVWDLNDSVLLHYDDLFLYGITLDGTINYDVHEEPGYTFGIGDGSRNPFRYFEQIPGQIRAQFMLENSRDLIDSLVKADVCTGNTATYAIRDHFWVWFLKPSSDPSAVMTDAVTESTLTWNLNPFAMHDVLEFDHELGYQQNLEMQMRVLHPDGIGLEDIWTGDGDSADPNSWLTVLRHNKSATVEWGAVGGFPETGWILTYTNFERLYYDLTVNFLTWQGALTQLETWTYMSAIRTEAEDLMISLFPPEHRDGIRDGWIGSFGFYDLLDETTAGPLMAGLDNQELDPENDFIEDPYAIRGSKETFPDGVTPTVEDLFERMEARRHATPGYDDVLNRDSTSREVPEITSFESFERGLDSLTGARAAYARNLPNVTVFRVTDGAGSSEYYTIIANRGYSSNEFVFGADRSRACDRDYISAFRGVVGNYPELFVDLPLSRATEFLRDVKNVKNESAPAFNWLGFAQKYLAEDIVIHRESSAFWPFVDDMHAYLSNPAKSDRAEAAILDLSQYVWFRGANSFEECALLP